ncbi:MAG: LysR family transcriptional regulator [Steroidobacteraceae bacterium]
MDLNLLVALDVLLAEQNVSVAAERLNLSQSATSGALARLRQYFGDELLINVNGRQMQLTPRGRQLRTPVRNVLLQIRATVTDQAEFNPALSKRRFTVLASDYAIRVVLCEAMRRAAAQAPDVRFDIQPLGGEPAERLNRAEVDFVILPQQFVSGIHPQRLLFEDEYVVVACADNPQIGTQLSLEQYFGMGHIAARMWGVPAAEPTMEDWFMSVAPQQRRIEVLAPSYSDVPQMLLGTRRIATLHRRLAEMFATRLPLKLVPVPLDIPRVRETLQWNRLQQDDPGVLWLAGLLTQVCTE